MQQLVRGIHNFQMTHFHENQGLYEQLARGQHPDALLITCSDSRIRPGLLTQAKPGEIFVLRNAGNIVPPYGASSGGEGATIEYGVAALGVKHIIVMGHSHCGAMKGLLHPEDLTELPLVAAWLKHAEATRRVIRENYQDCEGQDLINAAIKENVLMQLDNLRTYPAVASRLIKGELTLHGWIYHIDLGQVLAFDPALSQFVPITSEYQMPVSHPRFIQARAAVNGAQAA